MRIAAKDLETEATYKLITGIVVPRPIAWVTTLSPGGIVNLAPFSFFTCVSPKPPLLAISVGRNAGVHDDAVLPGMSAEQWRRVIDVSVNGFFNATQPLLLPMIRTRWGRIINISSVAALTGNRGQVNYAAAKGALNAATKALSLEVASRGITVNAVAPGIIATDMGKSAFDADAIDRIVPMKRAGSPDEVASLVAFLASAESGYITGQVISINGGMI